MQHSIFLCDNDYLNLINHKDVIQRQVDDLESSVGRGVAKSSFFLSDGDPHSCLEKDMGDWFGKECYLAQSGYAANVGLMHAICRPGVNAYVDQFLHMSFYDGLAARHVNVHSNKHKNFAQLEANIRMHGPGVTMVESVYSISGALAPLEQIVRIKKQYSCVLVVDESHSFGVSGSKGYAHMMGLQDRVVFATASLAKAYAIRAGIIFTSNALHVKENSFTYIFSSGLMRNDIVWICAIWEVVKAANDRRRKLLDASHLLRTEVSKVADVIKSKLLFLLLSLAFVPKTKRRWLAFIDISPLMVF
ncbi:PLP-dependent transferase [Aspergillus novofumigatus IBT 16806]|uniref:PLP-dependent transferase n=1 Tax=Aspergillus novofumigatus (strain IBT 16806) TaxID=1392255 RepID=A0A2I1C1N2_ASPN1|nr:PLP-dependent transferase [Aspergillus novofumigatus IBT 16806]PKX91503.1 PLP-dependent transferase [Aspergillus novofumigatus IBT 16806]